MSSETMDMLLLITNSVFVILVATLWGVMCIVTANRPAGDRDALLQALPPATAPMPLRLQQLRLRVKQISRRYLLAIGPLIGLVFFVVGMIALIVTRAPLDVGALVAALFAVFIAIVWELLAGTLLVARYWGAKKRIMLDAQRQGSPDVREE